jgi:protein SCO1
MRAPLRSIWGAAAALLSFDRPEGSRAASRGDAAVVPNLVFTTQDNVRVRLYDDLVRGKVVLINFMFTSCTDVCPRASATLFKVAAGFGDRLEREVRIISLSVDPRKDTPAVLKKYAAKIGAPAGWYFLTGKSSDLETVRERLGVNTPGGDKSDHTGMIVYGNDRTGQWATAPIVASAKSILYSVSGVMQR